MPTMQEYLEYRRKTNPFAQYLGIEMTELDLGYAAGELELRPEYLNNMNGLHGGCLFTVADTICGNAASSYGYKMTTLSADFNYLRPCLGAERLFAVAKEVKHGKRVSVYSVELSDGKDTVFATGTFTFFNLGVPLMEDMPKKE